MLYVAWAVLSYLTSIYVATHDAPDGVDGV